MTFRFRAGAVAGVAALLLSACSAGDPQREATPGTPTGSVGSATARPGAVPAGLARFYDQRLRWTGCGGGFQCTRVKVPLDYAHPDRRAIELSVIRRPAGRPKARKGSLLLNPGGPGVSGVDYARAASSVFSSTLRDRFDVVGFDPRGVGGSTPVECLDDKETDAFIAADGSPDTPAEEQTLVDLSRHLADRCGQRSGELLAHVGTRDAARDLDVLRAALGDRRLHYLGKSYGTYLGATYAELFPSRVGTMVLDGALDPAIGGEDVAREQAVGFEVALQSFVDDCLNRGDCPLRGSRKEALARVSRFLADVDRRPLKATSGRRVTESLAVLGVVTALYDEESGWPLLRTALGEAFAGDGSTLLMLADFYTDRNASGHYTTNSNDAIYAVNCLDRPTEGDLATVRSTARSFERVAPHFGDYIAWSELPCASWPYPPQGQPHPVRAAGSAPILVVGTTRDPATPYKWAKALAGQLDNGHLLTFDGDGHTAYRRGSSCIDRAVDRYLVDGRVPAAGTRCR